MPTLNINGRRVKVADSFMNLSPDEQNATVEEIASSLGDAAAPAQPESPQSQGARSQLSGITQSFGQDKGDSAFRSVDSFMRGAADTATFGMADEIAAMGNAMGDAVMGTPGQYDRRLRQERIAQELRDQRDPVASNVGRVAGAVGSGIGMARGGLTMTGNLAADAGLGGRMLAGAGDGAAMGGAYGFGSGEGVGDRLTDAAGGAVAGGLIGGAVPAAVAGVRSVAKPAIDAVKARMNPGAFADQKVAERLRASGMSPDAVANRMANSNGLAVADAAGKSARDLLRTAVNIPGPAKDRVAKMLTLRQFGQGDRLKSAIQRTFADPDGYLAAKDDIVEASKQIAGPLYRKAYSNPVHYSEQLEGILQTPAGKAALRKAEELAGNEQVPFQQLFVQLADDGTGTVRRVPDTRGWDYIKRAMDDLIDGQTDSITRKVTNEGRILTGLKNRMLAEVDRFNPDYKAARGAAATMKQLDDAIEFGRKAGTMSPEAVRREMASMNPQMKEAARVGAAEDLRKAIDGAGFTNNAVLKIFNSRQKVGNLRTLFDNDQQFGEFRRAIFDEARKRSTYEAVKGNSTTASQLADMFETGGLKDGAGLLATAATQGPVTATLQYVGSTLRRLGGLTPEVADQISRRLLTTSPTAARDLMTQLSKIEAQRISAQQKSQLVQSLLSRVLTTQSVAASSGSR